MSAGDLKTDGLKGNNFPWQLKMLKGLESIIDAINSSTTGGNVSIVNPLGENFCEDSVSTTLCRDQASVRIIPGINRVAGLKNITYFTGANVRLSTLSIYNEDTTTNILVSIDNGINYVPLYPGTTISYDAGGLLNYLHSTDTIFVDQNLAHIEPLIIYTYIL